MNEQTKKPTKKHLISPLIYVAHVCHSMYVYLYIYGGHMCVTVQMSIYVYMWGALCATVHMCVYAYVCGGTCVQQYICLCICVLGHVCATVHMLSSEDNLPWTGKMASQLKALADLQED